MKTGKKRYRANLAVKNALPILGLETVKFYVEKCINDKKILNLSQLASELEKRVECIKCEMNQKPVKYVRLIIEWTNSRMYKYNANLTADISYEDGNYSCSYKTKASGCGYDKRSQTISDFLQDNMAYLLYDNEQKILSAIKDNKFPYGATVRKYRHYYGGAVGYNSLTDVLDFLGYEMKYIVQLPKYDVIDISIKGLKPERIN